MNVRRTIQLGFVCTAMIAAFGCEQESSPAVSTAAESNESQTAKRDEKNTTRHGNWKPATNTTKIVVAGLEFTKPAMWIESQPLTTLRHSNYSAPGRSGEQAAELAVFELPDAQFVEFEKHVQRWQQQFAPDADGLHPEPVLMEVHAGDVTIAVVKIAGSFRKSGAAWFIPGQAMLAAVTNSDQGQVVLRLSGSRATVEAHEQRFLAMIESRREVGVAK